MAGRIPQHFIDELIARTDIIEVIGSRVQLKRAGREYKACCPFHDEKTASFTVSADKQFYHCFGCGAHGTALGFVMEYDHLGFVEAVEDLAARAGLDVPREGGSSAPAQPHDEIYVALERAALFYRQSVSGEAKARDYLAKRGLAADVIQRFGIGYAPARWDALLDRYGATEDERQVLHRAGLVVERQAEPGRARTPGFYDRFRDRVMFPIRDTRGRTIGFGGRVLDGSEPKYLNSPETELFHKGRELYGLFECRQATRSLQRLLVVEGYMDVVSLHQAGITYAVATLGTATTPEHLQRIFRLVGEVVFCFDGDRAGRAAAWRALENAVSEVKQGRQVRFLFLPDGHDPDTLVREEGAAAFESRLAGALPLSDYLIRELSARSDPTSVDGRAKLVELARPLIRKIPSDVYRELLVSQLAEAVRMQPTRLAELLQAGEGSGPPSHGETAPTRRRHARHVHSAATGRGNLVRQAISLLVHYPAAAAGIQGTEALDHVDRPGVALLIELLAQLREDPPSSTAALLERWRERPEHAPLSKLATTECLVADTEAATAEIRSAIERLVAEDSVTRLEALQEKAREAPLSAEEKLEIQALIRNMAKGARAGRAK
ncbi:MAG: DNA primase [Steroidobacteraceae bacterium]|nr:DNA primase [Steroidobacteraceae bacterium]